MSTGSAITTGPFETVKRALPTPLKDAIKAARRRAIFPTGTRPRHLPPRNYRLDEYGTWFPYSADLFRRYLKDADVAQLVGFAPAARSPVGRAAESSRVGVVVTPWVNTPVPWYAIMLAIGLAKRGRDVTLIHDDSGFVEPDAERQARSIDRVLQVASQYLPVTSLVRAGTSGAPGAAAGADGAERSADAELVDRLTQQNLLWALRGEAPGAEHSERTEATRRSLAGALPLVRSVLRDGRFGLIVVPGGVYGTSGLFVHESKALGGRVATFDTDRRIAQICVDGVAAQNADIPTAFDAAWDAGVDARRHAVDVARAELHDRRENRDQYGFQVTRASQAGQSDPSDPSDSSGRVLNSADGCVLIPLNVEWDTAALGRHVAFADTADWLVSTIRTILDLDGGPVLVRQHPSERRPLQRSRLDIEGLLQSTFGGDPRCRFVGAADPVSSYDLLQSSRLVLPYVSTIGIEAAAMGKPVLISGECYFSRLGFVWSATSRAEYLELLQRGLRGDLPLRDDQVERAWLCYYLTAVLNREPTDFTPHPDDFWTWCQTPPAALFSDPVVSDILEALDTGVPLSLLRHHREIKLGAEAGHEDAGSGATTTGGGHVGDAGRGHGGASGLGAGGAGAGGATAGGTSPGETGAGGAGP